MSHSLLKGKPKFSMLFILKSFHAVMFVLFSCCLVYILYGAITEEYHWGLFLAIGAVLIEGLILLANGWQCPLTTLARKYGDETGRITDMFFPAWFVPHVITFYTAFFVGTLIVFVVKYIL